ncbi:MAG: hypothetical protein JO053_14145, partial [Acidobacteria bacterium]|nr:hypothetical protein [Acidobacteriota bacterium]
QLFVRYLIDAALLAFIVKDRNGRAAVDRFLIPALQEVLLRVPMALHERGERRYTLFFYGTNDIAASGVSDISVHKPYLGLMSGVGKLAKANGNTFGLSSPASGDVEVGRGSSDGRMGWQGRSEM